MSAISQIGSIPLPPAAPQRRRLAKSKSPVQQAGPAGPRRMCQVGGCSNPAVPDFVVQQGGDGTKCYNHGGNNWGTPPPAATSVTGVTEVAYAPINYSSYTPDELHRANVENVATAKGMTNQFNSFVENRMLLAFRETISRLKKQGQRLNGHSDVDAYFKSIGMTYSNVRQLFSREKKRLLESMGYEKRETPDPPVPHLTKAGRNALIEASLRANALVTALEAGHDGKTEMASFKAVMSTKRLDDIVQAQTEPEEVTVLKVGMLVRWSPTPPKGDSFVFRVTDVCIGRNDDESSIELFVSSQQTKTDHARREQPKGRKRE